MCSKLPIAIGIALVALSRVAQAYPADSERTHEPSSAPDSESSGGAPSHDRAPPSSSIGWRDQWPHARPWEYAVAPALIAGGLTIHFALPAPTFDASAGNAFDRRLQDAIQPNSRRYVNFMDRVSDVPYFGLMAYRALEDTLVVGWARESWDVAVDLMVMDATAFGLIGTVVWGSQLAFGRRRPNEHYCATSAAYREKFPYCQPKQQNRSFISGHFAIAVAGASLTCTHHDRLDIYSSRTGGTVACVTAASAAAVEGVARSTAGQHWPTDMLLGGALGFTAGWILPRALHYGFGRHDDSDAPEHGEARAPLPVTASIIPVPRPDGGTVQVVGTF